MRPTRPVAGFFWSALVLVYGGVSIGWTWLQARRRESAPWPMLRGEVLHWLGALVTIEIVLLFELKGITARGTAADSALLILALSTVTAVGLGFLDQLSILVMTIPLKETQR